MTGVWEGDQVFFLIFESAPMESFGGISSFDNVPALGGRMVGSCRGSWIV